MEEKIEQTVIPWFQPTEFIAFTLKSRPFNRQYESLHFLKVVYFYYFFLVGYAFFKDISHLFGAKFTVENSTDDVMTIDQ